MLSILVAQINIHHSIFFSIPVNNENDIVLICVIKWKVYIFLYIKKLFVRKLYLNKMLKIKQPIQYYST